MTNYRDFMHVNVEASVECNDCGTTEDATGSSEGEAERNLCSVLRREGWDVIDRHLLCRKCRVDQA